MANDSLFPGCPVQLFSKLVSGIRMQAWLQKYYLWFGSHLLYPFFFPVCFLADISECSLLFLGSCFSLTVKKCLNLMVNLVGLIDRVVRFPLPPNTLLVPQEINILWGKTCAEIQYFCLSHALASSLLSACSNWYTVKRMYRLCVLTILESSNMMKCRTYGPSLYKTRKRI